MSDSKGYWKDVLTILDDYSAKNYKREPTTLETVKSIQLRPALVKRQKTLVLDEYMRLKAIDTKKVTPPPYLEGQRLRREKTLVGDPWRCEDQAVRQLANVTRKSPWPRYFHGFGDPKLQNATSIFGVPLRPAQKQIKRLRTDVERGTSWPEKQVLPDIGKKYGELENTAESPMPVTPLERGITLLYDVDEKCTRKNDDGAKDDVNNDLSEKERTFITSRSDFLDLENEEFVRSSASGSLGFPVEEVELPVEEIDEPQVEPEADNLIIWTVKKIGG
ncbi:uncharacterized protein LOC135503303 isoform X2 [Lineus longissimus]|uniref:uncharacterized protein LOC135503303 isoform X2 n=1 Tax=Lineus longissimus TaxID=88925 RepID=UPI002B4F5BB4